MRNEHQLETILSLACPWKGGSSLLSRFFQSRSFAGPVQRNHPTKPVRVTVPHPKKDLPIGTLESIEKQADIKLR
jgi:hypothetical protein